MYVRLLFRCAFFVFLFQLRARNIQWMMNATQHRHQLITTLHTLERYFVNSNFHIVNERKNKLWQTFSKMMCERTWLCLSPTLLNSSMKINRIDYTHNTASITPWKAKTVQIRERIEARNSYVETMHVASSH